MLRIIEAGNFLDSVKINSNSNIISFIKIFNTEAETFYTIFESSYI